jgi:DedD protein
MLLWTPVGGAGEETPLVASAPGTKVDVWERENAENAGRLFENRPERTMDQGSEADAVGLGQGEGAVSAEQAPARTQSGKITITAVPTKPAIPEVKPAPAPAAPKPAASASAASKPAVKPAQKAAAASAKPAPSAQKTRNDYWVQAGSFVNKSSADNAKAYLAKKGIGSIITNTDVNGKTYYRVRVGPYTSSNEADYWLALIKSIDGCEKAQVWRSTTKL